MKHVSTRTWLLLGLLVPSLLIIIPAISSVRSKNALIESYDRIARAMEAQSEMSRLLGTLVDAETGQRGYLLTNKAYYLAPYERAVKQLPEHLAVLEKRLIQDAVQNERMNQLRDLISARMSLISRTLALSEQGKRDEAMALIQTDQGLRTMDAIRAVMGEMQTHEEQSLISHQAQLADKARANSVLMLTLVIANTVFVIGVFALVVYLTKLRNLVTMCAWSRTIEYEGEWISFEEYLSRRFNISTSHGISPKEAQRALDEMAR